jgi:hypothetical protein
MGRAEQRDLAFLPRGPAHPSRSRNGLELVAEAAAALRRAEIGGNDIGLRRPTLHDVFR